MLALAAHTGEVSSHEIGSLKKRPDVVGKTVVMVRSPKTEQWDLTGVLTVRAEMIQKWRQSKDAVTRPRVRKMWSNTVRTSSKLKTVT